MTGEAQRRALVATFAAALKTQDAAKLCGLMSDDVTWSLPGTSAVSGVAHGLDGILARVRMLAEFGVNIEVTHVVVGLTGAALLLHNTGSRGGRVFDEHLTTVFQIEADLISRIDTYISDVAMLDAYFAP